jgi:hypothetical protein
MTVQTPASFVSSLVPRRDPPETGSERNEKAGVFGGGDGVACPPLPPGQPLPPFASHSGSYGDVRETLMVATISVT